MAIRLNGALFSLSIQQGGSVGPLTYTRDGKVYPRVSPGNPQTAGQGNVRAVMIALQRAIGRIDEAFRETIKAAMPLGYRWNSYLYGLATGPQFVQFEAALDAYLLLDQTDVDDYENAGDSLGLVTVELAYADRDPITPGQAIYAVCRALSLMGLVREGFSFDDVKAVFGL